MNSTLFNEPFIIEELLTVITEFKADTEIVISLTGVPESIDIKNKRKFRLLELLLKFMLSRRTEGDVYGVLNAVEYTTENLDKCIRSNEFQKKYQGSFCAFLFEIYTVSCEFKSKRIDMETVCVEHFINFELPVPLEWNSFISSYECGMLCFYEFMKEDTV